VNTASSGSTKNYKWDEIASVAREYLESKRSWLPGDFRLENRGLTRDAQFAVVHAIHIDDERNPTPGGGRSLELHIDPAAHAVVRELGFQ
jgi:hypothetical protein